MPSPRLLLLAVVAFAGCVESDASVCSGDDDCIVWQLCTNGVCAWPTPDAVPLDGPVRDAVEIDQPWPDMEVMRVDAEVVDEGRFDGPCAATERGPRPCCDHSDADANGRPDHDIPESDAYPLDHDWLTDITPTDENDTDAE